MRILTRVYASVVTAAPGERVGLQVIGYGFVLGAVLRYSVGALVVTNVSAIDTTQTGLYRSPYHTGTRVAVSRRR